MIETLIGVGQENESKNSEPFFFVGNKTQNKMAMHQHFFWNQCDRTVD